MKEIIRWHLTTPLTDNPRTLGEIKRDDNGEYVLYLEHKEQVEQLQARIKELESERHINEIKAQGIEEFIGLAIKSISIVNGRWIDAAFFGAKYIEKLRTNHD